MQGSSEHPFSQHAGRRHGWQGSDDGTQLATSEIPWVGMTLVGDVGCSHPIACQLRPEED